MKLAVMLALLVLVGCDPALWQRKPMTPEQQRAYEIKRRAQVLERHCRDVEELTRKRELKENSKTALGFSGGFMAADSARRAGKVAYRECMARYGAGPLR